VSDANMEADLELESQLRYPNGHRPSVAHPINGSFWLHRRASPQSA
jgi:hypothetical protein